MEPMVRITPSSNEFGDRVYRVSCDCGWFGRHFYTVESAELSLSSHVCPPRDADDELESNRS